MTSKAKKKKFAGPPYFSFTFYRKTVFKNAENFGGFSTIQYAEILH
jgi:hypothetical protein